MLEIKYIREHKEEVIKKLAVKGFKDESVVSKVLDADKKRRTIQQEADQVLNEINMASKEIGELFKSGQQEEANNKKDKVSELKNKSRELNDKLLEAENEMKESLVLLPNLPHDSVPNGQNEEDNEIVKQSDDIPQKKEGDLPHWELTEKYGLIDFELGNKISGAGFPVYKGKGARLQRALINYFIDKATAEGYQEFIPPLLVNEDSGYGTGQLPDKEGQMYHVTQDDLYLIPTAEVPITNLYRDVILNEDDFPIKMTAYTPCFRREAGSYGKDVRGLNRLHQFDKVEIVQLQHPERSYETLDEMVSYVESLVQSLGLPYRILRLCGGDISFASALTYDFEVYSAAQERWLEVSSVSNFESFQANRMKLRFKDKDKGKKIAHTLNGSALALPRIVAALLENNQTKDGIEIPEVLRPYTGFDLIN